MPSSAHRHRSVGPWDHGDIGHSAAADLDAADGVMDGKFFGRRIVEDVSPARYDASIIVEDEPRSYRSKYGTRGRYSDDFYYEHDRFTNLTELRTRSHMYDTTPLHAESAIRKVESHASEAYAHAEVLDHMANRLEERVRRGRVVSNRTLSERAPPSGPRILIAGEPSSYAGYSDSRVSDSPRLNFPQGYTGGRRSAFMDAADGLTHGRYHGRQIRETTRAPIYDSVYDSGLQYDYGFIGRRGRSAAAALDAADGVMDGKYYGRKIVQGPTYDSESSGRYDVSIRSPPRRHAAARSRTHGYSGHYGEATESWQQHVNAAGGYHTSRLYKGDGPKRRSGYGPASRRDNGYGARAVEHAYVTHEVYVPSSTAERINKAAFNTSYEVHGARGRTIERGTMSKAGACKLTRTSTNGLLGVPCAPYRTRAVLVGIDYPGTKWELQGGVNDAQCLKRFLQLQGWKDGDDDMKLLTDAGPGAQGLPTKANIIHALKWLVEGARAGDALFFGFSGHGSQVADKTGDEADGLDEVLITSDQQKIVDDDLKAILVESLPAGALLTCVIDCCHSGTALDLPNNYRVRNRQIQSRVLESRGPKGGQVVMFSACQDEQEAQDVKSTANYAGGACTNALLTLLGEKGPQQTVANVLAGMAQYMEQRGLKGQAPALASRHPLTLNQPFGLSPRGHDLLPLPQSLTMGLNPLLSHLAAEGLLQKADPKAAKSTSKGWMDFAEDAFESVTGIDVPDQLVDQFENIAGGVASGMGLDEIVQGLKEALQEAVDDAVVKGSSPGGYGDNSLIRIPFPQEAMMLMEALEKVGQGDRARDIEETLNRSAEDAAASATEILIDAVLNMSMDDAKAILQGSDREATDFMHANTYDALFSRFAPMVTAAMEANALTRYWDDAIEMYNRIPFVSDIDFDLDEYTVTKALDGLFTLIGEKEAEFRANPGAAASGLVQKMFQWNNDGCPE